mmetsp:Transcript_77555/g.154018  ORF Transcript_77555/g.154018 Transcript_77555/m.154018 type:complete len:204 (-) Transcript_77555:173-784(-)
MSCVQLAGAAHLDFKFADHTQNRRKELQLNRLVLICPLEYEHKHILDIAHAPLASHRAHRLCVQQFKLKCAIHSHVISLNKSILDEAMCHNRQRCLNLVTNIVTIKLQLFLARWIQVLWPFAHTKNHDAIKATCKSRVHICTSLRKKTHSIDLSCGQAMVVTHFRNNNHRGSLERRVRLIQVLDSAMFTLGCLEHHHWQRVTR